MEYDSDDLNHPIPKNPALVKALRKRTVCADFQFFRMLRVTSGARMNLKAIGIGSNKKNRERAAKLALAAAAAHHNGRLVQLLRAHDFCVTPDPAPTSANPCASRPREATQDISRTPAHPLSGGRSHGEIMPPWRRSCKARSAVCRGSLGSRMNLASASVSKAGGDEDIVVPSEPEADEDAEGEEEETTRRFTTGRITLVDEIRLPVDEGIGCRKGQALLAKAATRRITNPFGAPARPFELGAPAKAPMTSKAESAPRRVLPTALRSGPATIKAEVVVTSLRAETSVACAAGISRNDLSPPGLSPPSASVIATEAFRSASPKYCAPPPCPQVQGCPWTRIIRIVNPSYLVNNSSD